jgi:hypothetical protein
MSRVGKPTAAFGYRQNIQRYEHRPGERFSRGSEMKKQAKKEGQKEFSLRPFE